MKCFTWLVFVLLSFQANIYGQVSEALRLKTQLEKFNNSSVFPLLKEFYDLNNNQLIWIDKENQKQNIYSFTGSCDQLGLNPKDYSLLNINIPNNSERLKADTNIIYNNDIYLSEATIRYFVNLSIGRPPRLSYNGVKYSPATSTLPLELWNAIKADTLIKLFASIQPKSKEYRKAIYLIGHLNAVLKEPSFSEVIITSNKVNNTNKSLIIKLYQLGILDNLRFNLNESELSKYLRKAQKMLDVLSDGILRSTSIHALNVPIKTRYSELVVLADNLRWLNQLRQNYFVAFLNIPSADLNIYDHNDSVLYSRVIVGKKSTPTPTLSSTITEIILYPYWMVPYKIATRELLPEIKKNINFLDLGGYQVLNKSGNIIKAESVNWASLNSNYFPYIIRQSTGCDNSLGLIKFQFESSYSVYLHDTPFKGLFYLNKRYFSHGCMRIEKPFELSDMLLGTNKIAVDTLLEKGCLLHQSPITLKVDYPLKIIVLYNTAWYSASGDITFYEDVYNKL